jgi:hypothetical protein
MKKSTIAVMMIALAGTMGAAMADGTSGSTTATTQATAPSLMDRLSASYTGVYFGASISDPLANYQPDENTGKLNADPEGHANRNGFMKNTFDVGYKVNDQIKIRPTLYFGTREYANEAFTLRDPYLRIQHASLFSAGKLNVTGDLRLGVGVSENSLAANKHGYVHMRSNISYDVSPRLTASMLGYVEQAIYGSTSGARINAHTGKSSAGKGNATDFYAGPQLEYRLSPTMTVSMLYEMTASRSRTAGLTEITSEGYVTDLEPGLNWDITPKVSFSPFLNLTTGNRIAADTTTLGAVLSLKLL